METQRLRALKAKHASENVAYYAVGTATLIGTMTSEEWFEKEQAKKIEIARKAKVAKQREKEEAKNARVTKKQEEEVERKQEQEQEEVEEVEEVEEAGKTQEEETITVVISTISLELQLKIRMTQKMKNIYDAYEAKKGVTVRLATTDGNELIDRDDTPLSLGFRGANRSKFFLPVPQTVVHMSNLTFFFFFFNTVDVIVVEDNTAEDNNVSIGSKRLKRLKRLKGLQGLKAVKQRGKGLAENGHVKTKPEEEVEHKRLEQVRSKLKIEKVVNCVAILVVIIVKIHFLSSFVENVAHCVTDTRL